MSLVTLTVRIKFLVRVEKSGGGTFVTDTSTTLVVFRREIERRGGSRAQRPSEDPAAVPVPQLSHNITFSADTLQHAPSLPEGTDLGPRMFSLSPEAFQQLYLLEAALPPGLRASLKAIAGLPGDDPPGGTIKAFPEGPGESPDDAPLVAKPREAHADRGNDLSTQSESCIVPPGASSTAVQDPEATVPQPAPLDATKARGLGEGGTVLDALEPSRDQAAGGRAEQPDASTRGGTRPSLPTQGGEAAGEPSGPSAGSEGNVETECGHVADLGDITQREARTSDQPPSSGDEAPSANSVTQPNRHKSIGLSPAAPHPAGARLLTETPTCVRSPSLPGGPASLVVSLQAAHIKDQLGPASQPDASRDPGTASKHGPIPQERVVTPLPGQDTNASGPAAPGDFSEEACFWPSEVAPYGSPGTVWMRTRGLGPNQQPTQVYGNPIAGLDSAGPSADWGVDGGPAPPRDPWWDPAHGHWVRGQAPEAFIGPYGTMGTLEQPGDPSGPWSGGAGDLRGQYGSGTRASIGVTPAWEVGLPPDAVFHSRIGMTTVPNAQNHAEQNYAVQEAPWDVALGQRNDSRIMDEAYGDAQGRWGLEEAGQLPWMHVDPREVSHGPWQAPADGPGAGSNGRRPSDSDVALVSQIHGILERVRTVRPPCFRLPSSHVQFRLRAFYLFLVFV